MSVDYGGEEDEFEEYEEPQPVRKARKKPEKECNSRLDELAKPKRWLLLGTWREHGWLFEPKRMKWVKEKVQELFSMTPEETEQYFNSIRTKKSKRVDVKALRRRMHLEKMKAVKEAYTIMYRLIKKALKYAYKRAPPLLVTPILRIISDNVMEILCGLHRISIPKRNDCENLPQFLFAVADWTAIFVSNIYYEIEVEERNDIENINQLKKIPSITSTISEKELEDVMKDKSMSETSMSEKEADDHEEEEEEEGVTQSEVTAIPEAEPEPEAPTEGGEEND